MGMRGGRLLFIMGTVFTLQVFREGDANSGH